MAPRKQPLQPITNKLNIPTGTTTTTTTTTTTKHPNIGDGKCIEDIYQKKTQLEHILLRPDTYIGSTEKLQDTLWTYISITDDMSLKQITYVPGLYKIFDEILVNMTGNYYFTRCDVIALISAMRRGIAQEDTWRGAWSKLVNFGRGDQRKT
ncbi:unnamed protein product [Amaranthus hypochondriacus]